MNNESVHNIVPDRCSTISSPNAQNIINQTTMNMNVSHINSEIKQCCSLNPSDLKHDDLEMFALFNFCIYCENQSGAIKFALHFFKNEELVNKMWKLYMIYGNALERSGCYGHTACVEKLLPYIHPDFRIYDEHDEYDDWTALENAVFEDGDINVTKILLTGMKSIQHLPLLKIHKANINNRDYNMRTPLIQSVHGDQKYASSYEIVQTLIEFGADVKLCDDLGNNFILETIQKQSPSTTLKILTYLRDKNLLCDQTNIKTGGTAMHLAAYFSDKKVIKFLIECGFDCNAVGRYLRFKDGKSFTNITPIFLAYRSYTSGVNENGWENVLALSESVNNNIIRSLYDVCDAPQNVMLREHIFKKSGMSNDISHMLSMICWLSDCYDIYMLRVFALTVLKIPSSVYEDKRQTNKHWWFVNQIILYGGTYSLQVHEKIDKKYQFVANMTNLKIAQTHIDKIGVNDLTADTNLVFKKIRIKLVNDYYAN